MKENATTIASNEPAGEKAYRLRFPVDWDSYDPGQFVMVEVPGGEVFLRRPFGIARMTSGLAEICYKVVGRGTAALAAAEPGTELRVTGPCGKGFRAEAQGRTAVLVAGGYGIGPLFGLCERLVGDGGRAVVYYGAKAKADLLYLDDLEAIGAEVSLATEDGSEGARGLITEVLKKGIGAIDSPALYACGPEGLLKAVAQIGMEMNVPTQVSTEAYMACGIGVCMGCVCRDRDGKFVRTCKDGPVFEARELKWE